MVCVCSVSRVLGRAPSASTRRARLRRSCRPLRLPPLPGLHLQMCKLESLVETADGLRRIVYKLTRKHCFETQRHMTVECCSDPSPPLSSAKCHPQTLHHTHRRRPRAWGTLPPKPRCCCRVCANISYLRTETHVRIVIVGRSIHIVEEY